MNDKELKEFLRGAGREIAVEQMSTACETASDSKIMKNQLDVLYYSSLHIIATRVYNGIRQQGLSAKDLVRMVREELERELHFIIDTPAEGLEFSGPKGDS